MRQLVFISAAAAMLTACGSRGTTFTHDAGGGTTVTMGDTPGGPAMVAKVAGAGSTVAPADLPAWAPVYPGAKVSQVVDIAFNKAAGMPSGPHRQVVLMTADPVAKVMAFYDAKLAAAGVKPVMSSNAPDGAIRAVGTSSGQPDTISVGNANGQTGIGITYEVRQ